MTFEQFIDLRFDDDPTEYTITVLRTTTRFGHDMMEHDVIKAVVDEENKRVVLIEGNVVTNNNSIEEAEHA